MNNVLAFANDNDLFAAYASNKEMIEECIQAAVVQSAQEMGAKGFVEAICTRTPELIQLAA